MRLFVMVICVFMAMWVYMFMLYGVMCLCVRVLCFSVFMNLGVYVFMVCTAIVVYGGLYVLCVYMCMCVGVVCCYM